VVGVDRVDVGLHVVIHRAIIVEMKALQLTKWSHDAELRDVPQPDPRPGEVLVRVAAAGACHSDLHLMHDFVEGMVPYELPFTIGHENAGWVEVLGDGVTGVEVGEPVAVYGPWGCGRCHACLSGAENYCERQATLKGSGGGLGFDGGMASYMLVPNSRWLVPLDDLDPVLAAPLTDAGLTPYHAIKRSLPVLVPGSFALLIGAGGLGHLAIQILRALSPATVIVVDQRADALEHARHVGAHEVVQAGDGAAAQITDITKGRGIDVAIDLVGVDDTMQLASRVTRPRGHITLVGIGGGMLPVRFFSPAYEVSVATTYWGTLPELVEVLALARTGLIRPEVQRFALDDAPRAYADLSDGKVSGRAVILPND
jgi:propanol-preferring alcohol dehydrogenase